MPFLMTMLLDHEQSMSQLDLGPRNTAKWSQGRGLPPGSPLHGDLALSLKTFSFCLKWSLGKADGNPSCGSTDMDFPDEV